MANTEMDPPHATSAQTLCRRILASVKTTDDAASISSVSSWDHTDATLVRIRASKAQQTPLAIVSALRSAWPLATVSLVENVVDGSIEAQMAAAHRMQRGDGVPASCEAALFFASRAAQTAHDAYMAQGGQVRTAVPHAAPHAAASHAASHADQYAALHAAPHLRCAWRG